MIPPRPPHCSLRVEPSFLFPVLCLVQHHHLPDFIYFFIPGWGIMADGFRELLKVSSLIPGIQGPEWVMRTGDSTPKNILLEDGDC